MSKNVITPEFRCSYPNLFKSKKNDINGKDEYSVVALFSKGADLSVLKAAAQEAIVGKWGSDKNKWPKGLQLPFRDQGDRAKIDETTGKEIMPSGYEKGAIFITLKTQNRPQVVDESVQPIIEETKFYAGCFARASVRAYAYDVKGKRGVAFGLQNVQKTRDGDPLSGRAKAEDEFAPIAGADGQGSVDFGDLNDLG